MYLEILGLKADFEKSFQSILVFISLDFCDYIYTYLLFVIYRAGVEWWRIKDVQWLRAVCARGVQIFIPDYLVDNNIILCL